MVIRVSDIPEEGIRVQSPDDVGPVFAGQDLSLDAVALTIERRAPGVVVQGRLEVTARLSCSRCLEPLVARVGADVDVQLLPTPTARQGEVELGPDDLEVDFYTADTLDVGRIVRSETDLALPMKPLCRPDCRGLCPACGGNRNLTDCRCETRPPDPRLAPLEALRRLR